MNILHGKLEAKT